MKPITRDEMYLAAAAGEYSGELPEPVTRLEYYLKKIKEAVENGSSVAPEDIDAAIEAYLNSHDADIVTEAELADALEDKADSADIPDVSGFIDADVNNLTNYYDKDTIDTALDGKQNVLTFDNAPTENSNNPVKSGGVYTALANVGRPTGAQVQTAVNNYLENSGIGTMGTMADFKSYVMGE